MSYLDKLLQGAKVEWKTLGEVAELKRGKTITAKNKSDGTIPVISGGQKPAYYNSEFNREGETITVAGSGAYAGCIMYWNEPIFVSDAFTVKPILSIVDTKYIFHFLLNNQEWIYNLQRGSGVPHVYPKDLEKLFIPIPPLSVQKEIVRILDTFTELTAELTAELAARKKQYNYYRDQLLSFEDNEVEWKTLGEIFDLKNGYTPSKLNQEYWKDGTIPWFRMEDIRENGRVLSKSIQYVNSCAVKGNKVFPANSIIVATSATIGEHALITVPYLSNQRFTNLSLKGAYTNKFLIKFLFYYGFVLDEWCKNNITVGNFAGVDMNGFKKFLIPVPPLAEQKRIVAILDKFDTLTTSLTEGLPKEIELRKKQYEYYRDMLLSFPKDNA